LGVRQNHPQPALEVVATLSELRTRVSGWRLAGERIAFVPTMGNLHAGHFALVERARTQSDRVVASVFVNPTQFGPNEDFARYPRTPAADEAGLRASGCDLLFRPDVEVMYPFGLDRVVRVAVPGLSSVLCGAHRPGHFDGVATVVLRLLCMVQPDIAIFGRKDLQQLQLIHYLATDFALPVRIDAGPTTREADGLAMSSRNQFLTAEQRPLAARIRQCLGEMLAAAAAGNVAQAIEAAAMVGLRDAGFDPDYAALRFEDRLDESLWGPILPAQQPRLVALIAARLGSTRLIDNVAMSELHV